MIVTELIEHLKTGDQQAVVGVLDHFGKLKKVEADEFTFEKWENGPNFKGSLLHIPLIDIGPEPD
jgi:hypothetical protein